MLGQEAYFTDRGLSMLEALVQLAALRIKEDGAQIYTQILCFLYSIYTHDLKAFRAP